MWWIAWKRSSDRTETARIESVSSIFGTKEEILARLEGYKRMNAWTDAHPEEFTLDEAFAMADELYDMMTPEARARRDDPTCDGAGFMLEVLSRLT